MNIKCLKDEEIGLSNIGINQLNTITYYHRENI